MTVKVEDFTFNARASLALLKLLVAPVKTATIWGVPCSKHLRKEFEIPNTFWVYIDIRDIIGVQPIMNQQITDDIMKLCKEEVNSKNELYIDFEELVRHLDSTFERGKWISSVDFKKEIKCDDHDVDKIFNILISLGVVSKSAI